MNIKLWSHRSSIVQMNHKHTVSSCLEVTGLCLPLLLPTGKKGVLQLTANESHCICNVAAALFPVMLPTTTDETSGLEINNEELELEQKHGIET